MITNGAIPRRSVEADPVAALMGQIKALQRQVSALERGGSARRNAPATHTHRGTDISGPVATAELATEATTATYALGSKNAYTDNVQGTSIYPVWVGDSKSYTFGRNTSSIRYKENVRAFHGDPADVLALQPVIYDRRDRVTFPTDPDTGERVIGPATMSRGATGEYGLIAEQVAENVPELVQWYEGRIDSVRYDLLGVALLDVVKAQDARISALEEKLAELAPDFSAPTVEANPRYPAPAAPYPEPEPLPYEIGDFSPWSPPWEPTPADVVTDRGQLAIEAAPVRLALTMLPPPPPKTKTKKGKK